MRRFLAFILMMISLSCGVTARERTDSVPAGDDDSLIVSLITCAPGPDVYELCGHSAIRIRNAEMDSVWNYGIFDFDTPNFVYRFCKGQTDYMVMGYPFEYFLPQYVMRGSRVTEQVLDLSPQQAATLRKMLQTESLPQNRTYRYNYVRDNCATRPWQRIRQAAGNTVSLPDTLYFPTFREEMKHYHRNYPWYQFGIDLALGSGIDTPLQGEEDTFAPPVLAEKLAKTSLVAATDVIYPGVESAILPPTPWYLTPMAAAILVLALSVVAWVLYFRRNIRWRWLISAYFLIMGIAGFIITFLVFVSEHEATSPNWLILYLNPLQLIPGLGIWFRSWRKPVRWLATYDTFVAIWFGSSIVAQLVTHNPSPEPQAMNPAMLPVFAAGLILSLLTLMMTRKKAE